MACPDPLLLSAYVDGELEAESALRIEDHFARCPDCTAKQGDVEALRAALLARATYHRPAPERRAEMISRFWQAVEPPRAARARARPGTRQYWFGAASGALLAGLAAFAITLMRPDARSEALVGDLIGAHVRSLLSEHLIDVASSDRHTVKPWFAGHADVSPPVVDLADHNYPLIGGRVDYVDGRRAAVSVYRRGAHVVNVFAWPDTGARLPRGVATRSGYNLVCWQHASIDFCAASDAAGEELLGLTRLLAPSDRGSPVE